MFMRLTDPQTPKIIENGYMKAIFNYRYITIETFNEM